ncbi:MAG: glycosyltransferase family 1 protein [Bacteroidota bacterium]|nr:glycosyltransferase family 1 protein [Bacteroidota bacterium]
MNIGLDISNLTSYNPTGVGVYVANLCKALSAHSEINAYGFFRISRIKHFQTIKKLSGLKYNFPYIPYIHPPIQLFHGPDFWVPAPTGFYKKVITIHDLAIYHPEFYEADRIAYSVPIFEKIILQRHIDHYIFVSKSVENEFIERFPSLNGKTSVVYHGADHFGVKSIIPSTRNFPYIAYVGTIEKRKNVSTLIQAFAIIAEKNKEVQLIISGKLGNDGDTILKAIPSHLQSRIQYLGYLPKNEAVSLVKNALFFVYPSVYEGFGFPIIEAMSLGTPVLTSSFGAMKEIAGNAAQLCNTHDIEELSNAINLLINNETLRKQLSEKGMEHAAQFTWDKCALQTIQVYNKVLSQ